MSNYFYFKGNNYGNGTVVQIYEKKKKEFKFYSYLIFEEYDNNNEMCRFRSPYNRWESFNISKNQLQEYIEKITEPYEVVVKVDSHPKVNQEHVEGIVDAWLWYILIMFFGIFLKGIVNVIGVWILASVVFFSWRHKKMNGE